MGCTPSRNNSQSPERKQLPRNRTGVSPSLSRKLSFKNQLLMAIKDRKWELDHADVDPSSTFSFAKIVLKFGTINRVLKRIRILFNSLDRNLDGHVSLDAFNTVCAKMKLDVDDRMVDNVYHAFMCGQNKSLNLRGFVVLLAVSRVMQPLNNKSQYPQDTPMDRKDISQAKGTSLSRSTSFSKIKWSRIPSFQSFQGSGGIFGGRSFKNIPLDVENSDLEYWQELHYVLDLIITAYFQFDTKAEGYISKRSLKKQFCEAEGENGVNGMDKDFLYDEKWRHVWESRNRLSFQGFVYIFSSWFDMDLEEDCDTCIVEDDVIGLEF